MDTLVGDHRETREAQITTGYSLQYSIYECTGYPINWAASLLEVNLPNLPEVPILDTETRDSFLFAQRENHQKVIPQS